MIEEIATEFTNNLTEDELMELILELASKQNSHFLQDLIDSLSDIEEELEEVTAINLYFDEDVI